MKLINLKIYAILMATLISFSGFAATAMLPNILNVSLPYGRSSSIAIPINVPRPVSGSQLRMRVPHSCSATVHTLRFLGRTSNGYTTALTGTFLRQNQDATSTIFTYEINSGVATPIYLIGVDATALNPNGCVISFYQGTGATPPPPPAENCELSTICPRHIDATKFCKAKANGGPSFFEYANGRDNSCTIKSRLSKKVCEQGYEIEDFAISCK